MQLDFRDAAEFLNFSRPSERDPWQTGHSAAIFRIVLDVYLPRRQTTDSKLQRDFGVLEQFPADSPEPVFSPVFLVVRLHHLRWS